MSLNDYKNVYCIGIGGIGLSAIARYFYTNGATVSGSDGASSRITDDLIKEGMMVYIGHDSSHIKKDIDLVIYTIAIPDDNAELVKAKELGIICMSYPEALGFLTKEYKTIAVCGTHGKTTTTAMIASMLKACGKSPTVIVGSLLSTNGTNFIKGDSEYLVVEACEYKRSFLNLFPKYIVVTNIDEDHLDYYKDINDIKGAFQEFANKLSEDGKLITHQNVLLNSKAEKINADDIKEDISLSVLGKHNKENAKLALSLAKSLFLDEAQARVGLKAFNGTWRRLEYKGETNFGVKVYDDYGHHPEEIKATIQALRDIYPKDKNLLYVFFQPHLYSRTLLLLDDFSKAFDEADYIYVMPIYASREKDKGEVSNKDLVEKLCLRDKKSIALNNLDEMNYLIENIKDKKVVVLNSGAGDAYVFLDKLKLKK